MRGVELTGSESDLWEQWGEGGLGVSSELVDLDFLDAEPTIDSFCGVDLVFEKGDFVVLFLKGHAFSFML